MNYIKQNWLAFTYIALGLVVIGFAGGLAFGYFNDWDNNEAEWCQRFKDVEDPPVQCLEYI